MDTVESLPKGRKSPKHFYIKGSDNKGPILNALFNHVRIHGRGTISFDWQKGRLVINVEHDP